jgi:hypothetical protein
MQRGRIGFLTLHTPMIRRLLTPTTILVTLLVELPYPVQAQPGAAWLDSAWAYRNPATIDNTKSISLSNFQLRVLLDGSFDFTKAKSDGSDLRITASDGTTLLPFWIGSWNATQASASIWVQVPSIPGWRTALYLDYANAAATSASEGNFTFDFFDDFQASSQGPQV